MTALATLAGLPPADIIAWTDGSVRADQTLRGGGALIRTAHTPPIRLTVPAGRIASSFATEITALNAAIQHILQHLPLTPGRAEVLFCTDSPKERMVPTT